MKRVAGLFLIMSASWLCLFVTLTEAAAIPAPEGKLTIAYMPEVWPKTSTDPARAEPVGVGSIAEGGGAVTIQVDLLPFSEPVDIYFGIYAPDVDKDNIYILKADNTFQKAMDGLVPWKAHVESRIYEILFGDISSSALPSGTYYLYLLVTPADTTENYYFWATHFIVSKATGEPIAEPGEPNPPLPDIPSEVINLPKGHTGYYFLAPEAVRLFSVTSETSPQKPLQIASTPLPDEVPSVDMIIKKGSVPTVEDYQHALANGGCELWDTGSEQWVPPKKYPDLYYCFTRAGGTSEFVEIGEPAGNSTYFIMLFNTSTTEFVERQRLSISY